MRTDEKKVTQELAALFDAFYRRFVLLDLFGNRGIGKRKKENYKTITKKQA